MNNDARNDHYLIISGKVLELYQRIVEAHDAFHVQAVAACNELGGCSPVEVGGPFDWMQCPELSAIAFKAEKPPADWRLYKQPVQGLNDGEIACRPIKGRAAGKAALAVMERASFKAPVMDFYAQFAYTQMLHIGKRYYWPVAGDLGGQKIAIIPREAIIPPKDAPEGCQRIEHWEFLQMQRDVRQAKAATH
ncbi:hypothetical protein [Cerasicoccus frondis]|uniref:hypothetical protein n=1 Tax=Cerasicoccus frondis TaxID=490090 RepID=UPI0028527205|nr:hypothetical protein [Cerasicoccus frondis]